MCLIFGCLMECLHLDHDCYYYFAWNRQHWCEIHVKTKPSIFKNITRCFYKDSLVKCSKNKSPVHHAYLLSFLISARDKRWWALLAWLQETQTPTDTAMYITASSPFFWVWVACAISRAIHQGQGLHCCVNVPWLIEMPIVAGDVVLHFGQFVQ